MKIIADIAATHCALTSICDGLRVKGNLPRLLVLGLFATTPSRHALAQQSPVIYSFLGTVAGDKHGGWPTASVLIESDGILYGTTADYYGYKHGAFGTVYDLTPPSGESAEWSEAGLYSFKGGNDGAVPIGGLVSAPNGTLYGTTQLGGTGSSGTVFSLTPPGSGSVSWSKATLYNFPGGESGGAEPEGTLVRSNNGRLYGTTLGGGLTNQPFCVGCGTVFEVTPPPQGGSQWKFSIIYSFGGGTDGSAPIAGLVRNKTTGALYGTTSQGGGGNCTNGSTQPVGCGTVFMLSPPSGQSGPWSETILYSFLGGVGGVFPQAKLAFDSAGNIYGTTTNGGSVYCQQNVSGCGVVFELTPPTGGGPTWSEKVLFSFVDDMTGEYPYSGLTLGGNGTLYGTTVTGGGVFELKPPSNGDSNWTEKLLHSFSGQPDGSGAVANVALYKGYLYGTTKYGGVSNRGTIFRLQP